MDIKLYVVGIPLRRVVLDTALCDKVVSDLRQVDGFLHQ